MEPTNNYESQDEIIISFRKIWDNIIRYWWICVIFFLVATVGVVGLTLRSHLSEKKALEEIAKGDDEEDEEDKEYTYSATSMVYMAREHVDLNKLMKDIFIESPNLEERKDYVELYKEYTDIWLESTMIGLDKTLLYDCLALVQSNTVISEINNALIKNGFKEYDVVLDAINMTLHNNARFYSITVNGEEPERVEFIVNTATKLLMDKSVEVLGIERSVLIDEAVIKEYLKNEDGSLTLVTPRLEEEKAEIREKAQEDADKLSIGLGSFITMKKLLILFVGIFFGLGIIFIMILLDKKIRTRNELEMYFPYPVMGDVNESIKDDEQYNILMTSLDYQCTKSELSSLLITGAQNPEKTTKLTEEITKAYERAGKKVSRISIDSNDKDIESKIQEGKKKGGILIVNATNINKSASTLKAAELVDGIVMAVSSNNEGIPDIQKAFSNIMAVDGNVLGCILIDKKRFMNF